MPVLRIRVERGVELGRELGRAQRAQRVAVVHPRREGSETGVQSELRRNHRGVEFELVHHRFDALAREPFARDALENVENSLFNLVHIRVGDILQADGEGRLSARATVASARGETAPEAGLEERFVKVRLRSAREQVTGDAQGEVVQRNWILDLVHHEPRERDERLLVRVSHHRVRGDGGFDALRRGETLFVTDDQLAHVEFIEAVQRRVFDLLQSLLERQVAVRVKLRV